MLPSRLGTRHSALGTRSGVRGQRSGADSALGPLARLDDPRPGVRRTAILDLAALGPDEDRDRRLLRRLAVETDARATVLLARVLSEHRHAPALPVLWGLYAERSTPVEVAHAAVLAHDRLERAVAGGRA